MNNSVISKFSGVFVSLFIIWLINELTVVDYCLEQGGKFEYRTGTCLLENGVVYSSANEVPLIILYVFIGFFVTFFVSKLLNKLVKLDN
ncbi:MAG: hypothetical protein QF552_07505 [Litorilituus sp.]|jgi:hypothetical protein|nr:hypothetical protein [Litorilituus sp.]